MPPFTIGTTPVTNCNGLTAMPPPNDTVMVAARPQLFKEGYSGRGGPGNSTLTGFKKPSLAYQACSIFGPTIAAMREAPIFDDTLRICGIAIHTCAGSKSRM